MTKYQKLAGLLVLSSAALAYGCRDGGSTNSCVLQSDCDIAREDCVSGQCVLKPSIHCDNKVLDGNESDVDCGGSCPNKCAAEKRCNSNGDCDSANCQQKLCVVKSCTKHEECSSGNCDIVAGKCISCSDNVKNGDETDVDCGGTCTKKCDAEQRCNVPEDCLSKRCDGGHCVGGAPNCQPVSLGDLVLNEVFASPNSRQNFDTLNAPQMEFIEIVNVSAKALDLSSFKLTYFRNDKPDSTKELAPQGCLQPKEALVLTKTPLALPSGTVNQALNFDLVNSAVYTFNFKIGESKGPDISIARGDTAISNVRNPDLTGADFVKHNMTGPLRHSPGLCSNGGSFLKDCVLDASLCSNDKIDNGNFESDVDCGGPNCKPCALTKNCNTDSDCESGACKDNHCAEKTCSKNSDCPGSACDMTTSKCATCSDGLKNHDESDVDCGGSCASCDDGKACQKDTDCNSQNCEGQVCKPLDGQCVAPKKGDLVISEALSAPNVKKKFFSQNGQDSSFPQFQVNQAEFIEIVNASDKKLLLKDLVFHLTEIKTLPLSGCLAPKQVLLLTESDQIESNEQLLVQTLKLDLSNNKPYHFSIRKGDDELAKASINAGKPGVSAARNPEFTGADELAPLSSPRYDNTPGYCNNGASFAKNCKLSEDENSCKNKLKDNDETDVDCGGVCDPCALNKACAEDKDCQSQFCDNKVCRPAPSCEEAKKDQLVITEVLGSPKNGVNFANSSQQQIEFIEIVNKEAKELRLDKVTLNLVKEGATATSIALKGCIKPKGVVLVIHGTSFDGMHDEALIINGLKTASTIVNSASYKLSLSIGGETFSEVTRQRNNSGNGKSQARQPELTGTGLVFHDTINAAKPLLHSPGYCNDGVTRFSQGCK